MAKVRIYLRHGEGKYHGDFTSAIGLVKTLRYGKIVNFNEASEKIFVEIECFKKVVDRCIAQAKSYSIEAVEVTGNSSPE